MTPEQVKYRIEALRWYPVYIRILQEKIAEYDKQIQIRKRQGRLFDFQEMMQDFTKERLQEVQLAQETTLLFVKQYADNDFDVDLIIRHYHDNESYMQIADSMFYSESYIYRFFKKAMASLVNNAKDVEPFAY